MSSILRPCQALSRRCTDNVIIYLKRTRESIRACIIERKVHIAVLPQFSNFILVSENDKRSWKALPIQTLSQEETEFYLSGQEKFETAAIASHDQIMGTRVSIVAVECGTLNPSDVNQLKELAEKVTQVASKKKQWMKSFHILIMH